MYLGSLISIIYCSISSLFFLIIAIIPKIDIINGQKERALEAYIFQLFMVLESIIASNINTFEKFNTK